MPLDPLQKTPRTNVDAIETEKPFSGRIDTNHQAEEVQERVYSGRVDSGEMSPMSPTSDELVDSSTSIGPVARGGAAADSGDHMLGGQPIGGMQITAGRASPAKTAALPAATKTRVNELRASYGKDAAKVANLQQLTASAAFRGLSESEQKAVLDAYAKNAALASELVSLVGKPGFKKLAASRQKELVAGMATHGGAEGYLRSLSNAKLLTLAESPKGPEALAVLQDVMKAGGLNKAEQKQVERIGSATFTPGVGLRLHGSAPDQAATLHMIRREMLASSSFRNLVNTVNADKVHPVTLRVGRNQPGHFVDAWNGGGTNTIDLADVLQFPVTPPAANPEAMTQGQNLAHVLAEARQGALGHGYRPSHRSAIQTENRYRADIGQRASLRLPPNDTAAGPGHSVVFQYDNGYREQVNTNAAGTTITSIQRHNPPPRKP